MSKGMVPTSGMLCPNRTECERMSMSQQQEPVSGGTNPLQRDSQSSIQEDGSKDEIPVWPHLATLLYSNKNFGEPIQNCSTICKATDIYCKSECCEF